MKMTCAWLIVCGSCCFVHGSGVRGESITYEQHARPIFKTHCFPCHGEGGVLKGGLDLRLARLIAKGGEDGPVIRPGDRSASRLFELLAGGRMPPERNTVTPEEIELIGRWIDQGARTTRAEPADLDPDEYITEEEREFWAFRAISHPTIPEVPGATHPIDAFVRAKLASVGLPPSPPAPRHTLIRRAYFDLIGLPPTPEELESALAISPAELVDRLLASPHYGERWARHWLDVAGYADSEGYTEADTERAWAWRYRDWVIRAFNDDMPYTRFLREQLAGDELVAGPHKNMSPEDIARLTATGFLRMVPDGTGSGGIDQLLVRNQVVSETIQAVTSGLLGLTVDCARCHNHRYDPISQKDYYRLRAVFEPALNPAAWKSPKARQISLYTDEDRGLAATIEARAKEVDAERKQKIDFFIARTLDWKLKSVPAAEQEILREAYRTPAKDRTEQQAAALKAHPSIRNISAGSLYLYDREYRAEISRLQRERAARLGILLQQSRKANPGAKIEEHNLADFDAPGAAEMKEFDERIQYYRDSMSEKVLKDLAAKAAKIRESKPEEQFIRALVETGGKPPATRLFHRGDHEQPRDTIAPGELTVVASSSQSIQLNDPTLPSTGRRLAFAHRLTDGTHPLTARVIVNRVWMHHFGHGLVRSPGDFGFLGERPSHPELLDWLARDFMAHGWRLKRLHRLIMTSATWQQSARRTERLEVEDPDNLLLARMNVRRLDAEAIRDGILTVSGALNRTLFGKPVPVMEDEVGQVVIGKENLDGERKPGKSLDLGGQQFRRSIYVQARRSRTLSLFSTFDAPEMAPNCTRRSASTVAPQALVFLNGDFAIQQAKRLADRVRQMHPENPEDWVTIAWQLVLARKPTPNEHRSAELFIQSQAEALRANGDADARPVALAHFCQALLSSNEFMYVD